MQANQETTVAFMATISKLTGAYRARQIDDIMSCFAPDEDIVLIGTGADEKRTGRAQTRTQVESDWSQTDSIEMSFQWQSVSAAGTAAWVTGDGAFTIQAGGDHMALPVRVSLVLEKRGTAWLIAHGHFSTPKAGQESGRSV